MKNYLLLFLILSFAAHAGIKEDLKEIAVYCDGLMKDSNKLEMVKGKWALTQGYISQLLTDDLLLRKQMVCDSSLVFRSTFEKNYLPRFEVRRKKRLNVDEIEGLRNELLTLVYLDKPGKHRIAFMNKWPGLKQYVDEKMKMLLDKKT